VAAVQLAERGRLGLEDPLVAHLPEFAGAGAPEERAARRRVTLRHLLAHTSGLDADWQAPG
jgi:CubicO group peptidase (beta-lactamase class C family)